MMETQANDQPLRGFVLEREELSGDGAHAAAARELLSAMHVLAHEWIEPLCVSFVLDCRDADGAPQSIVDGTTRYGFLQAPDVPDDVIVRPPWAGAQIEIVELDESSVAARVESARRQPCAEVGYERSLREVEWTATRARLPISQPLLVRYGGSEVASRVERRDGNAWAVGPVASWPVAPISLHGFSEYGITNLTLHVSWSIWLEQPQLIEEALERVLAVGSGWERQQ